MYVCSGSWRRASAPVDHHRRNVIRVWGRRRRRREGGHIYRRLRRRKQAQEKVLEAITDFAAARRRREGGGGGEGALASLTPKRWKIEIYSLFLPPSLSRRRLSRLPPPSPISTQTRERGAVSGEEGGRGDTLFGINSRISEEVGKGRGGGGSKSQLRGASSLTS